MLRKRGAKKNEQTRVEEKLFLTSAFPSLPLRHKHKCHTACLLFSRSTKESERKESEEWVSDKLAATASAGRSRDLHCSGHLVVITSHL